MLCKRIIACLDIKDGRTVKGVNFKNLCDAGDPVELGKRYSEMGIDELVYLDISASLEKRTLFYELVNRIAGELSIPFTVGGGINSLQDAKQLLKSGADKISLNSSAIANPNLIKMLSNAYGNQFVVVAIDAKEENGKWIVYSHGGSRNTGLDLFFWAQQVEKLGAGEILFTSMNHDGTKNGFALDALLKLSELVSIPVIASGGAGEIQHFEDAFKFGKADAVLAASVFHYNTIDIKELKLTLQKNGISIRTD